MGTLLLLHAAAAFLPGTGRVPSGRSVGRVVGIDAVAVAPTSAEPALRIGHGYDIHRMDTREAAGQPVIISGVKFDGSDAPDFELGVVAHSDGDVVYHSVVRVWLRTLALPAHARTPLTLRAARAQVDAILGALTMPDIGQLFPDNDPRLRGADSSIFMVEAVSRMQGRGYRVGNLDVTLICQKPRVNVEHAGRQVKERMIENLARLLLTDLSRVNVKARTHEKVDSVGECRAIECHVVVVLEKDPEATSAPPAVTLEA